MYNQNRTPYELAILIDVQSGPVDLLIFPNVTSVHEFMPFASLWNENVAKITSQMQRLNM